MANLFFITICTIYLFSCTIDAQFAPIVQLKGGKVSGIVQQVEPGHHVNFYEGIRYGRADRFAKPKPAESWPGVYNATTFRDSCPQFGGLVQFVSHENKTQTESEDCLYLDVWTPAGEPKSNRTVMVFIHGGAFEMGTIFTENFNGQVISAWQDIVLVGISYRLGPLGFLYADSVDAPGNLGLRDQILALQWVQENIHSFGGNPQDVTIFGISAGGSSVGALLLSPLANGLFKRAIMESGAPNSLALTESTSNALAKTKAYAAKLECPTEKVDQLVKCLKGKSVAELVNASIGDFPRNEFFIPIYGDDFLPLRPAEALKVGKFNRNIDLIYGNVKNEGTAFLLVFYPDLLLPTINSSTAKEYINKFAKLVKMTNTSEVIDYYFAHLNKTDPTSDELKALIAKIIGDSELLCPTILMGEQMAKLQPSVNFYSYRVTVSPASPPLPWMGVPHGTDQAYLFPSAKTRTLPAANKLSHDMIRAWATFAKTGHPTQMGTTEWAPALDATHTHTRHLTLDSADYRMIDNFYVDICNSFWGPRLIA